MTQAFIFDMDGTIVDNMAFHTKSWVAFFKRRGQDIDPEEFFRSTAGRQGKEILRMYAGEDIPDAEIAQLIEEKEGVYREMYAPHRATIAGFDDLIEQSKTRGVKLAVATSAPAANIDFTLDGLDLRRHFDVIVGAADVARGKPEPDAFLLAARRCGAAPADCIVFEDAPMGVEAARRAGMRCVVLATTLPAEAFAGFDNVIHIVDEFSELTFAELFGPDSSN